jgi:hypothetical protein
MRNRRPEILMKALRNVTLAVVLAATLLAVIVEQASAEPTVLRGGVWTTIIQDVPPTVSVGQIYTVKLKYTNRYRNRRDHHKRQRVKMLPWIVWGAHTTQSPLAPYTGYEYSNRSSMKSRWMEPGESRTVSYKISFEACLPPWGPDWGGQPGDFIYWGLPCASGHYYLRSTAVSKGSHWIGSFTHHYERGVFIVP